jgi:para-nitrobenzyl esterase
MRVLICGVLILTIFGCGQTEMDLSVVTIDSGKISGTMDEGVRVFRGIPYAAPPTGDRRWKLPQPVEPWEGVRECTDWGFSCVHVPYPPGSMWTGPEWGDPAEQREDCLHLNVWTTAQSPDKKLPVMVWIHGGSLQHESGSVGAYGGANLARKGVVAVTINYRLGPFGYLAHPELTRDRLRPSSGSRGTSRPSAATPTG